MALEQTELVLGRGEVYFDRFLPNTTSGQGERYIGNTTTFQISREIERLTVKRSYRGSVHEAKGHAISEKIEVDMISDNISTENWLDWFADPAVGVASYGTDYDVIIRDFVVRRGRYYQVSTDPFGNFYFDRAALRYLDGATDPWLIAGVDYEFDTFRGRFYVRPDSPQIADGGTVRVRYYQRPAGTYVIAPDVGEVFGALRFISMNQEGGARDMFFPMVRLSPQGTIDMKGDEWQQMRFNAVALRKAPTQPLVYMSFPGSAPVPLTADTTLIRADSDIYRADNGVWAFSS